MDLERSLLEKFELIDMRLNALEQCCRELSRLLRRPAGDDAEGQADGPVAPDKLRVQGHLYTGFPRLEWLLLECLWGRDGVAMPDVTKHLYGIGGGDRELALACVCKRVNKNLAMRGCPVSVSRKRGCLMLDMPPSPAERLR
jgi:hypothetical protein